MCRKVRSTINFGVYNPTYSPVQQQPKFYLPLQPSVPKYFMYFGNGCLSGRECRSTRELGLTSCTLTCLLQLIYYGPTLPIGSPRLLQDPPEVDEGAPTKGMIIPSPLTCLICAPCLRTRYTSDQASLSTGCLSIHSPFY